MPELKDLQTPNMPNWCPGCVLPGTLIHANPSVEPIETLREGDKVLGSDGSYHRITKVMKHMHDGRMFRIKSKYFGETTLTHEHPVLIVRRQRRKKKNSDFPIEWVQAEDLNVGDYLVYPVMRMVKDLDEIRPEYVIKEMDRKSKRLPAKVSVNDELLKLAGLYIAEGYVHRRSVIFTFKDDEQDLASFVLLTMERLFDLNGKLKLREGKHTIDVEFNSSVLARLFNEWFGKGASGKVVPHFMMLLPVEKQKSLIKGLWLGDGWLSKNKLRANYKTISPVLQEQVKMLLLRQGILPVVSYQMAYGMHKDAYSLQIVKKSDFIKLSALLGLDLKSGGRVSGQNRAGIVADSHVLLPIKAIETFDYYGLVHNFEVENVHSYVSGNAILHNCGDFGIWAAFKNACVSQGWDDTNTCIVAGIGCHGHIVNFVKMSSFEGLHGRALPVASGIKFANSDLNVVVFTGDGDCLAEGGNHFMHAARRNQDLAVIMHDNATYGLTTGQTSPVSPKGYKSKSTPTGNPDEPLNPVALAIATGATFVARGYSGDINYLSELMAKAVAHKGFAVVVVLQPCVTFNKQYTHLYFQQNIYKIQGSGDRSQETEYDPTNKTVAFEKALEWGEKKIPVGIFYEVDQPTQESYFPQITSTALVKQSSDKSDIKGLMKGFM